MAISPAVTLLLGTILLACSEAIREQGANATGGGTSTGAATPEELGGTGGAGGSGTSALTSTSSSVSSSGGSGGTGVLTTGAAGAGGSTNTAGSSGDSMGGSAGRSSSTSEGGGAGGASDPGATDGGGPAVAVDFTLAVIGSSTAAGEGASNSSRGWVRLLARELEARVSGDFEVRNLSVGGYASSHLMPGSGSDGNVDDALDEEPDLIIVALAGSNDLSNGVSTQTFLSRLATIRDRAVEAGVPTFFVGTAPKDLGENERETLLEWTDQMRKEFETCWTPQAPSYTPCFIDVFEALANASLGIGAAFGSGDGIHLNDAGHQRIFEIAEAVVAPYVCSVSGCTP